ncbi:MAG: hypothetical protein EOO29_24265, partial [Comamonadaceae bacterium]
MRKNILQPVTAAVVMALAGIGMAAHAQTTATQPTTTEKVKEAGRDAVQATERGAEKAWDATKDTTKRAANATERGAEKAWDATKDTTKRAANATERGAEKA